MGSMKRPKREPIVLAQMRPVTLFLVLSGCIAVTFAFINISSVVGFLGKILSALGPVLTGVLFAYLLNPAMEFLERRFKRMFAKTIAKHEKLRAMPRVLGSFLAVLLFAGSVVLLTVSTFSQVVDGISTFLDKLPEYIDNLTAWVDSFLHNNSALTKYINELIERISATELGTGQVDTVDITQKILSVLASGAAGTFGFVYDVVVGFVITVYLLISKERFLRQWKQILYAVAPQSAAARIDEEMTNANKIFGTAILGKMIDSLLIGAICFMSNKIMGMPYATLIAVIIGVTNMVPYFGPIFGAIPCILLLLMESPVKALYFLIFIVVLQQIDANLIDPRIVGSSIGLPAFWELFACLLGGGLFGVPGLILGVPVFALVYQITKRVVKERLQNRGRRGQITAEFLSTQLGVTDLDMEPDTEMPQEPESPYEQRFIQLDELDDDSGSPE